MCSGSSVICVFSPPLFSPPLRIRASGFSFYRREEPSGLRKHLDTRRLQLFFFTIYIYIYASSVRIGFELYLAVLDRVCIKLYNLDFLINRREELLV